jgi:hypothetical protein
MFHHFVLNKRGFSSRRQLLPSMKQAERGLLKISSGFHIFLAYDPLAVFAFI